MEWREMWSVCVVCVMWGVCVMWSVHVCVQSLCHPHHRGTALSKDRRDWHHKFLSLLGPGTGYSGGT